MGKDEPKKFDAEKLRREAERRLEERSASVERMAAEDVRALAHELQVHQIELEMQNEELRAAQLALEEVSRKYQDLFDFAPFGYFLLDAETRILELNLAEAALLGIERITARRLRLQQYVAVSSRLMFRDFCAEVLQGDCKRACEIELQRGEQRVWVAVEGIVMPRPPQQPCLQVTMTDVSAQKHAEDALRSADRMKDEFLAMLGHELRNPLATIVGGINLLGLPGAEQRLPMVRGALERQARQLTRLVDDLLDVSRISQGKISLQLAPVALAEVVTFAVEGVRTLVESKKQRFTTSLPSRGIRVAADFVRIEQVLSNLLLNAIKYTPEGGQIEIAVTTDAEHAKIQVKDNGVGIPIEEQQKIFDIFHQVDSSIDRSRGGMGLGLPLVRKLVEMHRGRVSVASIGAGQGSVFTVELPLLAESQEAPAAEEPAQGLPQLKFVVIEDNRDAAGMLATELVDHGHTAVVAHDGPSGVESVRQTHPDAVLLDIGLPELDGYEVAAKLRSDPTLAGTLIVAVTGYGLEQDRARSRSAGCNYHLVKPVDYRKLAPILAEWARGHVGTWPAAASA